MPKAFISLYFYFYTQNSTKLWASPYQAGYVDTLMQVLPADAKHTTLQELPVGRQPVNHVGQVGNRSWNTVDAAAVAAEAAAGMSSHPMQERGYQCGTKCTCAHRHQLCLAL